MMISKKPSILLSAAVLAVGLLGTALPVGAASLAEARAEHAASPVASPTDAAKRTPSPTVRSSSSDSSDSARYAEREKKAGQQEAFRGGGVSIYIGGSVLAVALLVILAILIL